MQGVRVNLIAVSAHGIVAATEREQGGWSVEQTVENVDVRCVTTDPLDDGVIYAGTQGAGVLKSDDAGRTWRQVGPEGQVVKSLAVSPLQPGVVYAGLKPALMLRSQDGGASWLEIDAFRRIPSRRLWFSPAEPPYIAYVQGIALSPTDPDVILAGIEFGAVVRSADGGKSWTGHRRGALRDCHTLMFHVSDGDWVYEAGGTGAGAAVSADAGVSFSQTRAGLDRHYGWACSAHPTRPDIWYASISPGPSKAHTPGTAEAYVYRCEGTGPWQRLSGGLPQPLNDMPYSLLTDPRTPDHLYAVLASGAVWHSADRGDHWERSALELGSDVRRAIIA